MKPRRLLVSLILLLGLSASFGLRPTPARAADTYNPNPSADCGSDLKLSTPIDGNYCLRGQTAEGEGQGGIIVTYLRVLIKFLSGIFGVLVLLMILISGFQYMTSAGSPDAVKAAKSRLTNAIIGLILFILMFGILNYLIPNGVF